MQNAVTSGGFLAVQARLDVAARRVFDRREIAVARIRTGIAGRPFIPPAVPSVGLTVILVLSSVATTISVEPLP